ncbi:MAG: SDR family oxidoreductase [Acidimicrobiia bacterium]|nr:SDR family oxidoreductase [Acidimicrobiia bacterium]
MALNEARRVAVVSGAATGLGRAYSQRLAQDGFDLALADLDPCDETCTEVEAAGGRCLSRIVDVTDAGAVQKFAAEVAEHLGPCDVLVNNAGIYPIVGFDDLTFDEYRRVMEVNVDSVFLMVKAFVDGMRIRGSGRIINIATQVISMTLPNVAAYTASKMAVVGLTRAMAKELGPHNITVNAVSPGLVRTETNIAMNPPEIWEMVKTHSQVIPRTLMPGDITGVISFLASEDASLVTGQNLYVNAGAVMS